MKPPLIVHVTGARPNFPKAAPVLAALEEHPVQQLLLHTGQHYDHAMSDVFLTELGLPEPGVNLAVGSGSHAHQTAAIMTGVEQQFLSARPDLVVVYGDVNSTLATALVCSKLAIPFAHVEAGLRSFDRAMPEEINRLVTDRLASLLLVTSPEAIGHLAREGVDPEAVHFVGNPMIDTLLRLRPRFAGAELRDRLGLPGHYVAATLHRPSNVDDPQDARELAAALHRVADLRPVVIPLHPRGRRQWDAVGLGDHPQVHTLEPLGYLDFMGLIQAADAVITDSGGVQEETTVLGVPCLTLRDTTERPVTITHGTNALVTRAELPTRVAALINSDRRAFSVPPLWDGHAGPRIARVLLDHLNG